MMSVHLDMDSVCLRIRGNGVGGLEMAMANEIPTRTFGRELDLVQALQIIKDQDRVKDQALKKFLQTKVDKVGKVLEKVSWDT